MNKFILTMLLYNMLLTTICAQTKNDTIMIERFNFEAVEKNEFLTKEGDWLIYISPMPGGFQNEFAPAKDFYMIQKLYHPNGIIRRKGKILGRVGFGLWKYFDENGKLLKVVDEDTVFGIVKPKDIVVFLNEKGIINGETGETVFSKSPMKTDGSMYRKIIGKLNIGISSPKYMEHYRLSMHKLGMDSTLNSQAEKFIPIWIISYDNEDIRKTITYLIDGNNINNYIKEEEDIIPVLI